MTPARRAKLECAIALIEQTGAHRAPTAVEATRNALIGMGATFKRGDPHTMRFAGVTATLTWSYDSPLIRSWLEKARAATSKVQPANQGENHG